jgi:hypothetical protein
LNTMETLAQDLNAALPEASDDYHQEAKALLKQGASKTAIRKAAARLNDRKCMSCPFHGRDWKGLKNHLVKHKDHFYGVDRLKEEKADFVERLLESHATLANEGIQQFGDVHPYYAQFADYAKSEYEELLFLSMLQIRLRRH